MPKPITLDKYIVFYADISNHMIILGVYIEEVQAIEKCNASPGSKVAQIIHMSKRKRDMQEYCK